MDVRNKRGADVGSDHHLMIATIRLKIAVVISGKRNGRNRRFNTSKLKNREVKEIFTLELRNRFQEL